MAYQAETDTWPPDVYQIAVTDPVLGGPDGPPNLMGLALAKRAAYQRLRGVTPWDVVLAAKFGYPDKACVMHGGVSWRAKVANNVAPGTDPTKWERWGFSLDELIAVFGDAQDSVLYVPQDLTAPEKKQARKNIGVMAYFDAEEAVPTVNEGVIWKEGVGLMTWNGTAYEELFLTEHIVNDSSFAIATGYTTVCTYTAPRAGKVDIVGATRTITSAAGAYRFHIFVQKNGLLLEHTEELSTDNASTASEGNSISCQALSLPVSAGDVLNLICWRFTTSVGATHTNSSMTVRYIG